MRRLLPGLIILASAVALTITLSSSDRQASSSSSHAAPPLSKPVSPYDSIRTDLADYRWPTDAGHIVTSCFGEYRRTHFHGGIDISTGDRTGYRVFASRAGYVSRIRIEADGYGKMLYVRHSDGYTTTYAHLDHFTARIEERSRQEQNRLEQYQINIDCKPSDFPVNRGELIAYTGETGTGSPHLHFEIRDENMNSINPLLCPQLQVEDHIAPEYRKLALVPLSDETTINNQHDVLAFKIRRQKSNFYKVTSPVLVTGRAGLAVYIRDRSDGSHYYRGVYRHRLYVDEKLHFEVRIDRVPMQEAHQIGLYYVRDLLKIGEGRFEKLFIDGRNSIPFLTPPDVGAGSLDPRELGEGKHTFRVISEDFSGHTAELSGTIILARKAKVLVVPEGLSLRIKTSPATDKLLIDGRGYSDKTWTTVLANISWDSTRTTAMGLLPRSSPDIIRVRASGRSDQASDPVFYVLHPPRSESAQVQIVTEPTHTGFRIDLTSTGLFTSEPSLSVEEGSIRRSVPLRALDERHYCGAFTPIDTIMGARQLVYEGFVNNEPGRVAEKMEVYPIVPGRRGTIALDNGHLQIRYDSLSVYDTLYLQPEVTSGEGTRIYRLLPQRAVLRNGLAITVRQEDSREHRGLFTRAGGRWTLIGKPADGTEGAISGRLTRWLDDVAVFTDSIPPSISNVRFVAGGKRRPRAMFRIWDDLSGVDYNEVKTYIDEKFVVPDIDGERRRATIQTTDPLTRGSHRLTIRLKDHLGNTSVVERRFVVP